MITFYIAIGFTTFMLLRTAVALINYLGRMWLPTVSIDEKPLVSILVPVRNEAPNLPILIESINNQEYNNIELIIYDDCSTDESYEILQKYTPNISYLQVIKGETLPSGWLGKNHACHNLAQNANGKYLLFIDADVRIHGQLILNSLGYLTKKHLQLLSIFPSQIMLTKAEWAIVPIMNSILLGLLPLPLISLSSWSSFSAANGQCMFFDAEIYKKHQFHQLVKSNKVEDIAIVKCMKKLKLRVQTLCSNGEIECRMYQSYHEAINGFAKNIAAFFGNSYVFMFVYVISTSFGFLWTVIFGNFLFACAYFIAFMLFKYAVSVTSQQNFFKNLTLSFHQQWFLVVICLKYVTNKINKNNFWKDRNID